MQSHFRSFGDHLKLSIVLFVLVRFCSTLFLIPRPTIRVATAYTFFVAAWSFPGCCIEENHQRTGGKSSGSRRRTWRSGWKDPNAWTGISSLLGLSVVSNSMHASRKIKLQVIVCLGKFFLSLLFWKLMEKFEVGNLGVQETSGGTLSSNFWRKTVRRWNGSRRLKAK